LGLVIIVLRAMADGGEAPVRQGRQGGRLAAPSRGQVGLPPEASIARERGDPRAPKPEGRFLSPSSYRKAPIGDCGQTRDVINVVDL
jgi:hypothetical protein